MQLFFYSFQKKELDFNKESDNAILTKKQFKNDDYVYIPAIFQKYSSDRIITMELIKDFAKVLLKTSQYTLKFSILRLIIKMKLRRDSD